MYYDQYQDCNEDVIWTGKARIYGHNKDKQILFCLNGNQEVYKTDIQMLHLSCSYQNIITFVAVIMAPLNQKLWFSYVILSRLCYYVIYGGGNEDKLLIIR